MTDEPIPLRSASRPEDVEAADRLLQRRLMQVSSNRFQPKIIWTLQPWRDSELKEAVEAAGHSPFVVHAVVPLPRAAIEWPGAPYFAQYAYLVMVEVRAENIGG